MPLVLYKARNQPGPDLVVSMLMFTNTNPLCFSSPMLGLSTSSDEDLDNDLRQGIDNIM